MEPSDLDKRAREKAQRSSRPCPCCGAALAVVFEPEDRTQYDLIADVPHSIISIEDAEEDIRQRRAH